MQQYRREKRIIFSSATLYRNKVDNFQEYVAEEEQFYDGYREYRSLLLSFLHFLTSLAAHFQSMTVTDSVSIAPLWIMSVYNSILWYAIRTDSVN